MMYDCCNSARTTNATNKRLQQLTETPLFCIFAWHGGKTGCQAGNYIRVPSSALPIVRCKCLPPLACWPVCLLACLTACLPTCFPLFAPNACHPLLACLFAYLLACLFVSLLACLIACHPSLCLFACQPAPCSRFRWMKHRVICESCSDRLKTMIPVLDALCNFLNTNWPCKKLIPNEYNVYIRYSFLAELASLAGPIQGEMGSIGNYLCQVEELYTNIYYKYVSY